MGGGGAVHHCTTTIKPPAGDGKYLSARWTDLVVGLGSSNLRGLHEQLVCQHDRLGWITTEAAGLDVRYSKDRLHKEGGGGGGGREKKKEKSLRSFFCV